MNTFFIILRNFRDHSFGTLAKFSLKLTMLVLWKILRMYQMNDPLLETNPLHRPLAKNIHHILRTL